MSGGSWDKVRLGDCCEIVSGSTPSRRVPDYWDGSIPWATPKDLSKLHGEKTLHTTNERITRTGYESCSTALLPVGSVLFSSRAPIGLVAVAGVRVCTNQGFKSLVPGASVDSSYLYWCLRHLAPALASRGSGSTFKEVSKARVAEFPIPLPPLPEQRRIAAILDQADAVRRKRQEALALTEELLRSAFHDMFGDPVRNPKGWSSQRLEAVSEIASGVTKGRKLRGKETVETPYLRVANVQDGYLDLEDVKPIEVLPDDVEKYRLEPGDIVLTEGGDPGKLGRGAVWRGQIEGCIHQNHIFRVRANPELLVPEYLSALLGSPRGKRYFLRAAKQTTGIAPINKTQLRGFPVLLPPLHLQQEFARWVEQVNNLGDRLQEREREQDNLFQALTQRAFRGEL